MGTMHNSLKRNFVIILPRRVEMEIGVNGNFLVEMTNNLQWKLRYEIYILDNKDNWSNKIVLMQ